ncbi:MAG: M20 aminoacylase family protein [Pseudomonadota bacterium]
MPVVNRIAEFASDMRRWRRDLHQIPELRFDLPKTSAYVADKLQNMGVDELHTGLATSGMVALIHGAQPGPVIGLRADMDALPIAEQTGADYASGHAGQMHACGHDGHTTMLLGAARYLTETRHFAGTVALIFQPAEEDGGGAGVMVEDGVMDRFDIAQVYALHTLPGKPVGSFHTTPGPIMAAVDTFQVMITGQGGHGAYPHTTVDPIPATLAFGQAIPTIVSRNIPARDQAVISLTQLQAGTAENIVPQAATMGGTIRTFNPDVQTLIKTRLHDLGQGVAASFGVDVQVDVIESYPATINHADQTHIAADVARDVGVSVCTDHPPEMGAEDFSYMLNVRPGAYLYLGQGDGPALHNPAFDFNDDIAPYGASFFARLVERALPIKV